MLWVKTRGFNSEVRQMNNPWRIPDLVFWAFVGIVIFNSCFEKFDFLEKMEPRIQLRSATNEQSLKNTWFGVFIPRHFLGRLLSFSITDWTCWSEIWLNFFFGKNCLMSRIAQGICPLRLSENRTWISRFIRLQLSSRCIDEPPMSKQLWFFLGDALQPLCSPSSVSS